MVLVRYSRGLLQGKVFACFAQEPGEIGAADLLHSVLHHSVGDVTELWQGLVLLDRLIPFDVPRHEEYFYGFPIENTAARRKLTHPTLDEEQCCEKQWINSQSLNAVII